MAEDRKCLNLRAMFGPSPVLEREELRMCVRCGRKCPWVQREYPLAHRARPLKGDGTR